MHRPPLGPLCTNRCAARLCLVPLLLTGPLRLGLAYTPDSPNVRKVVEKGIRALETQPEDRLGGKCLVGMVFLKEGHGESHPRVAEAVKACRETCKRSVPEIARSELVYSIGIALIFLCELNPVKYRGEIDTFLAVLQSIQKPHGGWGYGPQHKMHAQTGDTSMTQYAVLGLWSADRAGIRVPIASAQRVCMWLLRTQDPSGAWGYQGKDPGNFNRVRQSDIRHSMVAAGLGSVYICADLLGVSKQIAEGIIQQELAFPKALRLVEEQYQPRRRSGAVLSSAGLIKQGIEDGNKWFEEEYQIKVTMWQYYYLYALERYQSFRELLEGRDDPEPKWYNEGVDYLTTSQSENGVWQGGGSGTAVDTSFAILFLTRSTKRSIKKAVNYGEGRLTGGRGLPKDIANARVKRGKIVSEPLGGSADDVLSILEDPDHADFDALVDNPGMITLATDAAAQRGEIERFRRLVRGGSPGARQLAVQALARKRDFDNVPILIYALGDPAPGVAVAARDAMRFISRKFDGFGMPDQPTRDEQLTAVEAWKDWYSSIRPDAKFLD